MSHLFSMILLMNFLVTLVLFVTLLSLGLHVTSVVYNFRHDRERLERYRTRFSPGFWRCAVLGTVNSVASILLIGLTYLPGNIRYMLGKGQGGEGVPVLLVHGLYHNPSAWMLFKRCLVRAGFGNTYVYGYNSFTRTYAELVHELTLKMEQVLAENPGTRLALVGHSLGGLVIRGAMADDRFRGKLGAVITLGTPHQGSALAALGIGRLARQLRPANSIFEQLAAQKSDENVAKLSLFTSLDNMVFPTRLLEIAEPGWEQECIAPDVGHVGLLYDRGVVQKTIALLEKCQQSGGFECS